MGAELDGEFRIREIKEIKKEFLRKISHRFNTNLTSIYSAAEIAIDFYKNFLQKPDKGLLEEIFLCLKIIRDGSKELTDIIKEYLAEDLNNNNLEK